MQGLPITLSVNAGSILVVGGGEQATQKLRLARASGAVVRVVAVEVTDEIADLARAEAIIWHRRPFEAADLDQAIAVFVTGDPDLCQAVSHAARARSVPVNVVDQPALSTFQMPAIVDRDPISIAIATGGQAPALARQLRSSIEALVPARLGDLARFIAGIRPQLVHHNAEIRRKIIDQLIEGPVADMVQAGDVEGATQAAHHILQGGAPKGSIHLVGAGPGDPDLLTLSALRALSRADVVFYDSLVPAAILDRVRRDAERHFVGKTRGNHSMSQAAIGQAMVEHAQAGRCVVRLKGGDPFIFGRGGEEMLAARAANIPVIIVPGITAALGCAAAAGIPLTHRHIAGAVTLATGHRAKDGTAVDWQALAAPDRTLVIYMGQDEASSLAGDLIGAGLAPATPVAVIENGTRPDMKVACGPLSSLGRLAVDMSRGPCLIIIGDVVRLSVHWTVDQSLSLAAE
jgi:uroporphyrin-III C-methyltransferase/precorrin-2 dehydrogenase/sirohydrochlorin ferrochelatase